MNPTDRLRANLVTGSPLHVILFQREGMRPPRINSKSHELQSKLLGRTRTLTKDKIAVVGPKMLDNRAVGAPFPFPYEIDAFSSGRFWIRKQRAHSLRL